MAVARSFQGTVGSCTPSEPSTKSLDPRPRKAPPFTRRQGCSRPSSEPEKGEEADDVGDGGDVDVQSRRATSGAARLFAAMGVFHVRETPLPASATSLRFVGDGWAPNRRRQRHRRRCTSPRPPSWTRRDLRRSSPRNRGSSRAPLLQTRPRIRDLPTDLPRTNPSRFHGSESCHPSFFAFASA